MGPTKIEGFKKLLSKLLFLEFGFQSKIACNNFSIFNLYQLKLKTLSSENEYVKFKKHFVTRVSSNLGSF